MTIGGLWPALQYVSVPSALHDAEHQRDEPRLEAAAAQRLVHVRHGRRRAVGVLRLRREHALHQRAHERGRRPFAGDVTEREAERVAGGRRGSRRSRRRSIGTECWPPPPRRSRGSTRGFGSSACWISAAMRISCSILRLLELVAIEPRVLDRDRRFGRQRLERRARRVGEQRAALAAVEIQHADAPVLAARFAGFDVAHEVQRHADDVADAERDACPCARRRGPPSSRSATTLRLADAEDLFGNLAADRERAVGQRLLVAGRAPA